MTAVSTNELKKNLYGVRLRREVKACFSCEMNDIFKASSNWMGKNNPLPSWDDVENLYDEVCPDCGEVLEYEGQGVCPNCKSEMLDKSVDQQPKEIYEWWIVTDYLRDELRKQGEAVLEWGNNCYWGRTTTGQSIMMDHVIAVICEEMEILDGQKYSWIGSV